MSLITNYHDPRCNKTLPAFIKNHIPYELSLINYIDQLSSNAGFVKSEFISDESVFIIDYRMQLLQKIRHLSDFNKPYYYHYYHYYHNDKIYVKYFLYPFTKRKSFVNILLIIFKVSEYI